MAAVNFEERVRLKQDIPELGLRRGDVGLVCSTWFAPTTVLDVEFRPGAPGSPVRALLAPGQIQIQKDGKAPTN